MRYFILLIQEKLPVTRIEVEIYNLINERFNRNIISVEKFSAVMDEIREVVKSVNDKYATHSDEIVTTCLHNEEYDMFLKFSQQFTLVFYSEMYDGKKSI